MVGSRGATVERRRPDAMRAAVGRMSKDVRESMLLRLR